MDIEIILNDAEEKLMKTIENLDKRFLTVRAGRANPNSLDGVMVSYYGVDTPLKQLATISVPEARQLCIKPFDRSCLSAIERGINAANLGYNPNNDGETIRINIPALTEERRRELIKQVKEMAEEARIAARNIRRDALEEVKKSEFSEDISKKLEKDIQDLINEYNKEIENHFDNKQNELMTV